MVAPNWHRNSDNVARRVNWELCKKHGLENSERWYEHTPADVVENDEVELYRDLTIKTEMKLAHNKLDIILVEKAIRKFTIIDIAVPGDFNVVRNRGLES